MFDGKALVGVKLIIDGKDIPVPSGSEGGFSIILNCIEIISVCLFSLFCGSENVFMRQSIKKLFLFDSRKKIVFVR